MSTSSIELAVALAAEKFSLAVAIGPHFFLELVDLQSFASFFAVSTLVATARLVNSQHLDILSYTELFCCLMLLRSVDTCIARINISTMLTIFLKV